MMHFDILCSYERQSVFDLFGCLTTIIYDITQVQQSIFRISFATKQFDKSLFDELVQLGKLLLAEGNQVVYLCELLNNRVLLRDRG